MIKESNSNKINYIFNTFYQVLTVLTPLITAPYISRVLGADGVGKYSFTYSIVTYFVLLATLGTTTYGQRETAYHKHSKYERSLVFWETFVFRVLTTSILLVGYVLLVPVLASADNTKLLLIQSFYLINVALDITWFFQVMAQFVTITIRNTIVRLVGVVLIFALIKGPADVEKYCLILVLSTTFGLISTFPLLRGKIELVKREELHFGVVLRKCIPLFVPTIAIQVYTVLDKTMIGLFTISNIENGYYDQAEKIVKMTVVLVTSLSTVLAPKIASAYKQRDTEKVKNYLQTLFKYVCMVGLPIVCGLFSVSDSFVPLFLGPGYEKCVVLMKVFCPIVFFLGISNVTGSSYLVQTSQQAKVNISVIVGAIVNLSLNLILIPRFYSIGAAIASIAAEGSVTIIQLTAVNKDYRLKELFKGTGLYLCTSIMMLIVTMLGGKILTNTHVYPSIIVGCQVLLGVIVYFLILILFKDSMMLNVINTIKKRMLGEKNV